MIYYAFSSLHLGEAECVGDEEDNPDDEEPRLESWREPLLERPPNWSEALLGSNWR